MTTPRVFVATPVDEFIREEWVEPHDLMIEHTARADIEVMSVFERGGRSVTTKRNILTWKALQTEGITHIFWLDSDVVPPVDTVVRLLAHDKEVVSGLYHLKGPPYCPVVYELDPYVLLEDVELNGLSKVPGVGQGCVLVELGVYQELGVKEPWFRAEWDGEVCGEDIYFFRRLAANRIDCWLDGTIRCGHIGSYAYGTEDWLAWKLKQNIVVGAVQ